MIEPMRFSYFATLLHGELVGDDLEFERIVTDTRTLQPGCVFLALKGPNFDGAEFAVEAEKLDATGVIVERQVDVNIPQLVIQDAHVTLQIIAAENRRRSNARVIGLTGSQGKTTVKEMIGAILGVSHDCLVTRANLNNTIGVPLTLLEIEAHHQFAVIEMGANCHGEIEFSSHAVKPDIGLITNASVAHVEGFGSLEGIVEAKGEIIDNLAADGVMVLNAEDPALSAWVKRAGATRVVQFSGSGAAPVADYKASSVRSMKTGGMQFVLETPEQRIEIELCLLGRHNVNNAVAAATVALLAGASLADVQTGLKKLQPVGGRLAPRVGMQDCLLIDDTYNASPDSFKAAIDVLVDQDGEQILVAGEMKELGHDTEHSHELVGDYARQAGVPRLWAVGEDCRYMVEAFGAGAKLFENKQQLVESLLPEISRDTVILVKGSRGAAMDEVVNSLTGGS